MDIELMAKRLQVVLGLLSSWIHPTDGMHLLATHSGNFFKSCVLGDCDEECIDHRIRVSLAALASEAAMKEA